jgi:hypothetical protein
MKPKIVIPAPVYYALLGVVLLLIMAVNQMAPDELELEQRQYCQMVALHRADPTVGWPDFRHTYDTECTHHAER